MISVRSFFKTEVGKIAAFIAVITILACAVSALSKRSIDGSNQVQRSLVEGMENADAPVEVQSNSKVAGEANKESDASEPAPKQSATSTAGDEGHVAKGESEPSSDAKSETTEPAGAPTSSDPTEQCYELQECSYTDGTVDMSSCKIIETCMQPSSEKGVLSAKKCILPTLDGTIDPSMCWVSNVSSMPDGIGAEYI